MPTHAAIIQKTTKGYKAILCHFDGYPEGAGKTLRENYHNPIEVTQLINCGYIPSLLPTPKLTLKHKISYDESEFNKPAIERNSLKEILKELKGVAPYIYCFNKDKWSMKELKN
jgi:hypothetical protein